MRKVRKLQDRFSVACESLSVTRQGLAELLGVSRGTLRNWAKSEPKPFLELIIAGLKAYSFMPSFAQELTGSCLAEARNRVGMNQEDFASLLGISRPTISRWENDTPPRWVSFAVIALATKV